LNVKKPPAYCQSLATGQASRKSDLKTVLWQSMHNRQCSNDWGVIGSAVEAAALPAIGGHR